jgi:hypothetical protein
MMQRVSLVLLLATFGALALAACGDQAPAPTALQSVDQEPIIFSKDTPTPQDEEFRDELREGTFTICKVFEGEQRFTFLTTVDGPGMATAPLYEPEVTLGDGECADVYTAPSEPGIGPDLVTITEQLPEGFQVDRVAIWSKDEQPDGSFLITFHELGPNTLSVQGSIDAGKIGCVVIFYNSRIPDEGECTRTPGYWKTHPEAWPVDSIEIGGNTYTKEEAIELLWLPERGDKTKTLFRALVAAKLNEAAGTDVSCVADDMDWADAWMAAHPVCSGVHGNTEAWYSGEPLYMKLDDYNNGLLCAPHCEDEDDGGEDLQISEQ